MTFFKPAILASVFLAACGGPADLYSVNAPQVSDRISIAFNTVEIRDVSLPSYAAADEIAVEGAGGVVLTDSDVRWADTPERAVALELTRHLVQLSGKRVASEPWPFDDFPEAQVEIRFENLIASANGTYRASGQFFVSSDTGNNDDFGLFDLSVPYSVAGGPAAIANARGQLILDLAELIAREGLR